MKSLILTFLSILFLSCLSCNPVSLDDTKRRDYRDLKDFKFPGLKNIDLNELKANAKHNCGTYQPCPGFSLLGPYSLSRPVQNCICKFIDVGLKPLCEQEEAIKEELRRNRYSRDKDKVRDLEDYLGAIQDAKYSFADEIYEMADEVDEVQDDAIDSVEEYYEDSDKKLEDKFLRSISKLFIRTEIGGVTRVLDNKAETVCSQIDWEQVKRRRSSSSSRYR